MGKRLAFTFALTGRREWGHGTQGVALGSGLVGLSARAGPQTRLFPHYLHLLNFSILNTLPEGGSYLESYCGASPANDMRPLQAACARTFSEGLRRSTVAHFARKVRGTNNAATKHGLKIQQSHAPVRWPFSLRVRPPHFASKVSYSAGAATDDCAGQRKVLPLPLPP